MEDPRVVLFFLHKDLSNLRWMPSVHSAEWSVIDFCPNNAMQVSTLLLLATKQGDSKFVIKITPFPLIALLISFP